MEKILIAAPLYILREEAQKDLFGVLERLHEIGYDGVELLGLFGKKPEELRKKLDQLGMKALGDHVSTTDFLRDPQQVIADHKILGCEYLTIGWPDRDLLPGQPAYEDAIQDIQTLSALCVQEGITPLYHNHDFEFRTSPSTLDRVMEYGRQHGLCLEPDLGWMLFGGADPAYYLKLYQDCSPVIHLKDVYAVSFEQAGKGEELGEEKARPEKGFFEFRPVGYGLLDLPRLMPLCLACQPKWLVADHDLAYDRDSYEDLAWSLSYIRNMLKICGKS